MATGRTTNLDLALPVEGELNGQWGDMVNNGITKYVDIAVAGTQTISGNQTAVTLTSTEGDDTADNIAQVGVGATGSSQYMIIRCTGNPASLLTITAPALSKVYVVINATSTSQSVQLVGSGPTTGVTIVPGEKAFVAWSGSDFVKVSGGLIGRTDLVSPYLTLLGYGTGSSGTSNTFIGFSSGSAATGSTVQNTAVGQNSQYSLQTGIRNVAVGASALFTNAANSNHTALGFSALEFSNGGSGNTAVGSSAGRAVSTGSNNVLIGFQAGYSGTNDPTTGSNNILIGYNTSASAAAVNNEVTIGNASISSFRIPGLSVTWNTSTVPFRAIPPVGTKTSPYTLTTADVGKYVQVGTGGSITVPNSTFAEGDLISIFNNTSSTVLITCNSTTAYVVGVDTNRSGTTVNLTTRGVATVLFINATTCVISGSVS